MSPRRKYRTPRAHTRQILFDRPYGIKLEFLMDLYLKVVGDHDLELDMKMDKIKMVLSGDKDKNEKIAQNLMKLQGQLLKATSSDGYGKFYYEQDLFARLFKNQVQTKLLNDGLKVMGFESELTKDKVMITEVPIRELVAIQRKIYNASQMTKIDENKDIQNFLTLVILKTDRNVDEIIEKCLDCEVLGHRDDKLYFAVEKSVAFDKVVEEITNSPIKQITLGVFDDEEDLVDDFGFEGGKIVFVKDGENLEQSSYDNE